ncbi:MAG: hypothetical protein QOJ66_2573 [Ilumatobacteraceae bacterium]
MRQPPLDILPAPGLLIGDRRVTDSSGTEYEHIYAATGKPTVNVTLGGTSEIDLAVAAARDALPGWRRMSASARRNLLLKFADTLISKADELTGLQTLENSMPRQIAARSPKLAADYFAYNAGWTDKLGGAVIPVDNGFDYALEEPYGVVAVIPTWNGPLGMLGMVCAPALAAGNTLVIKPPEVTPFTALRFGELALEAGFPPGVINIVPAGPDAGAALVGHAGVDKIHFTGSGATARRVLAGAAENLTPVALELGGKSALIVFGDADIEATVRQMMTTLAVLSGQVCIAGTRVLVEAAVYDQVVELATEMIPHIAVGDPLSDTTLMGPVISSAACDRILGIVERAKVSGARLMVGGERKGGELADGFFVEPTLFADVDNSSELAQHEVFGPVLAVQRFESEEHAIRLANDTSYGLAGYINTNDVRRAHRVAAALNTGNVWINGTQGIPITGPFGGSKDSGYGRLGGIYGIREFMQPKNVWLAL